jgi:hypothetical protein
MLSEVPFLDALQPGHDLFINGLAFDSGHPVTERDPAVCGFKNENLPWNSFHLSARRAFWRVTFKSHPKNSTAPFSIQHH